MALNNPEIEGEFDEPINELLNDIEKSHSDLFEMLGFNDLRESLENAKKANHDDEKGDTVCPCCDYTWNATSDDVSAETVNR
jgi:hypothetical protein